MKRAMLPLLAGLAFPAAHAAQILPLALTGPAYELANQAYGAYDREDYDDAISLAQEALRQRSDVKELKDLIVLAERDKDRRDHPERYPDARPKPGYRDGVRSLQAYHRGNYPAAADAARKAIAQAPKNLDYRMMLIEALQRQQRLDLAQSALDEAVGVFGVNDVLQRRQDTLNEQVAVEVAAQGYQALAVGDNQRAVSLARDAVRRYPNTIGYRRLLVSALIAEQQYKKARNQATEALALNGNDATLLVQRGQMRQRLGDESGARQDYAQALAVGKLSAREQASLYAAMGESDKARQKLEEARSRGELKRGDEVQMAYFLSQAGHEKEALEAFLKVEHGEGLSPIDTQNAAYAAQRSGDDKQAITWFEKVLDYQRTGDLQLSAQKVFDTRRAVSDLSRTWGLTNTTTYRGVSTASGLSSAPGGSASTDSLQNSTEVFWRPSGYNNGRFVELYGRVTDTIWSKDSAADTGQDALQGAVGVRVKPFSEYNVMAAFERTFPIGRSNAQGDWLARLGYGSSIGTDLRVDVPSWWTSQFYVEAGRYLQASRNYLNSEWQMGRSIRLDSISPRLVLFPHVVVAGEYDSKMNTGADGRSKSGNAGGAGIGIGMRYWMRETSKKAPQSYIDLSVQYRERIFGDERAEGVVARFTYSW